MSRSTLELAVSPSTVTALPGRRARWLKTGTSVTEFIAILQDASAPAPGRHVHGERDFGVGYGNSSGYAADRHYVREWSPRLFRCA